MESESSFTLALRDIECPTALPVCDCETGWLCVATARTRTTCATTSCIKDAAPETTSAANATNVGVIVGPVVAAFVLLTLGLSLWALRKKRARDLRRLEQLEARAKRLEGAGVETFALQGGSIGRSTTSPVEATLSPRQPWTAGEGGRSPTFGLMSLVAAHEQRGPSPALTIKAYTARSINLDPSFNSRSSVSARQTGDTDDPFSDDRSVRTRSSGALSWLSQSTNLIPIAYVGAGEAATSRQLSDEHDADSKTERLSFNSLAPSFASFNSGLWDTPTIERANVVHLSQPGSPARSTPSSHAPSIGSQFARSSAGLPAVPPAAHSAAPANRSPLAAQLPVTRAYLSPAVTPSPSAAHRRNPFDEFPQPPKTPVTPTRPLATSPGGSYKSVSPSAGALRGTGDDDDHYSLYSLGPERPPLRNLTLPSSPERPRQPAPPLLEDQPFQRPISTASSVAAVHSATRVKVGREHEGPAKALFRSGSVTRSNSDSAKRFPHPPPPIPVESPTPAAVSGPRDRSSAQTDYSTATFSVLGGFPFILPAAAQSGPK